MKQEPHFFVYTTTSDAWDAMKQAISGAKESIYWEQYIFYDDEEGREFINLLIKKAKAGVEVKLLLDTLGSYMGISGRRLDEMKKAGIDVKFFQEAPKKFRDVFKQLYVRTHRKLLVIDESVAFIGGVNIRKEMKDWLDVHVEIHGSSVRSLLRSFAKMYVRSGGKKEDVTHLLKKPRTSVTSKIVEYIFDDHKSKHVSKAKKQYLKALREAKVRVVIFTPYYFPDYKLLVALWRAKKRGVRIDLLIPYRSDIRIATYVAYGFLSLLDKMGIAVHLSKTMMHGKGIVVDDSWVMVGSSNVDATSFYDNYEANVKISDKGMVKKLQVTLDDWISRANIFDKVTWKRRGRISRFKEAFSLYLYHVWYDETRHPKIHKIHELLQKKSKKRTKKKNSPN